MNIVATIVPVFGIAILGYLLAWAGLFSREDVLGIQRYVFTLALPVLLFDSMSRIDLPESIHWAFLLAYYIPTVAIYGVGLFLGRRAFGQNTRERAVYAMGCAFSNTVLIGLPLIAGAWGDEALLPHMMIVSIHTGILFTLTIAIAESGEPTGNGGSVVRLAGRTILGMLRNPIFVGLVLGLLANRFSLPLPQPLRTALGWIRASATPAALFVTGASMRQYRVMGHITEAGVMLLAKLFVHPVLVAALAFFVFRLPPLWSAVAVTTAALPIGVNVTIFAHKYDASVAPVVTATLISTGASIVTLSIVLLLLAPLVPAV